MSKIIKECKSILKEAKKLGGVSYPLHPDGKLIPRAKGHITLINK